jgi:hypothetical protein
VDRGKIWRGSIAEGRTATPPTTSRRRQSCSALRPSASWAVEGVMSGQPALARLLESFFRNRLTDQRNATPATIASYRDALCLLVLFASERIGRNPCAGFRP